jgi:hypothetical protein
MSCLSFYGNNSPGAASSPIMKLNAYMERYEYPKEGNAIGQGLCN